MRLYSFKRHVNSLLDRKGQGFFLIKSDTYAVINNKYKYVWELFVLRYIHGLSHVTNGASTIYYIIYNLEKVTR